MSWHLWTVTTSQAKLVLDVWHLSFFSYLNGVFVGGVAFSQGRPSFRKKNRQNSRIHGWCVHIFQAIFCQTFLMLFNSCKMYKTMWNQQQHCSFRFWRLLWDWWRGCFCHLSSRHLFWKHMPVFSCLVGWIYDSDSNEVGNRYPETSPNMIGIRW